MKAGLPAPSWVHEYQREWLRGDLLAGVTVTAYLVPQVMAYAELAGLPAATGLWAAVGALFGYFLFGSSGQLSVGPESTTALMTAAVLISVPAAADDPASYAAGLALIVAIVCLVGLVGALPRSRGAAVSAGAGGIHDRHRRDHGGLTAGQDHPDLRGCRGFLAELVYVARHLQHAHVPTLVLGVTTLVLMLTGSILFPRAPIALIGVLSAAAASAMLGLQDHGVRVIGEIPFGFPTPGFPDLPASSLPSMLAPALGVAFVGYTDNVLTGRAFAVHHRRPH